MSSLIMNTHNAVKALKDSGIEEIQAEKIVEVIVDLQSLTITTKEDLREVKESIKRDISLIKVDMDWAKKLILVTGIAVIIAALKYIFIG
ncbi:hypothetical protein [Candidatus Schneideria nysicola]|uniref:hypothetical protein n=1 Tax=Candidatus Schneideria nysicola TaxID=1081631 RepID=UPI001CAA472C|nr:hypothetical protein [Candidatus Schneideria nysicola]UAJ65045.1 hypothetical protein KEC35_00230 [Candidatus Schneideria nysicola]UAJ65578.1 hypothetical protein KEC37_00230 [Candidatus Schneideria nysicola]UAJ66105.1 hypothetical protein KEC38_00230 [Candidatus Schneideria nysicola]